MPLLPLLLGALSNLSVNFLIRFLIFLKIPSDERETFFHHRDNIFVKEERRLREKMIAFRSRQKDKSNW